MTGNWDVFCRGKQIGRCSVTREGLYYRFVCRCHVKFDKVCCLQVQCADSIENLGVLIPMEDGFGLNTKLPAKRFPDGEPTFAAMPKKEDTPGIFTAVYPEEPFAYLAKIRHAYMERNGGQIGIVIREDSNIDI